MYSTTYHISTVLRILIFSPWQSLHTSYNGARSLHVCKYQRLRRIGSTFILKKALWCPQAPNAQNDFKLTVRVTRLPIGLLFTLGSYLKITEVTQMLVFLLPRRKPRINFGQKNGLGNILGDFFTNSSGHSADSSAFFRVTYQNKRMPGF
jgi:hypothetical protein